MSVTIVLVVVTGLALCAEVICALWWVPFYFRTGIPLYRRSFRFAERPLIAADDLSGRFRGSIVASPIIFHALGPSDIAFIENVFAPRLLSYTPVMRGLIEIDEASRRVRVTGYLHWYPLAFSALFLSMGFGLSRDEFGPSVLLFPLFLLLILGTICLVQLVRFSRVFVELARRYSGDSGEVT